MLARNIHDEDTVELQLSATELELLNQAAAEAENAAREAAAPEPQPKAVHGEPGAAVEVEAAPAEVPANPPALAATTDDSPLAADVTAISPAAAALAETQPAQALVSTTAAAAAPLVKRVPVRTVTAAATLVPVAFPERTDRLAARTPSVAPDAAPSRTPERARGTLQLVPITPAPPPAARVGHATSGLQALRTVGHRLLRPRALGLRTAAAAVAVAAAIAILLWPKAPATEPAATPTTAPAPTVVQPLRESRPETTLPTAAVKTPALAEDPGPMRFRNPFDSTEVFEFPAGTSYVDARDQVAQLLLTRARERSGSRDSSTSAAPATPSSASNKASFAQQL